ncbi:MAG: hypothetical protein PHU03_03520 [Syntrophales bacterium]|nr:hypothetical protein [Syntrophales bacterium]
MMRNGLAKNNPLRCLEQQEGAMLFPGGMGLVLSPAGVGKTAFVVQIAIQSMLAEKKVLHISLSDSIEKISLWYRELYQKYAAGQDLQQSEVTWQAMLPCRFIMTFKIAAFSVPVLEERLADLVKQGIFTPSVVIIDGLSLESNEEHQLSELKALAVRSGISIWITGNSSPDEDREPESLPSRLSTVSNYFEMILELNPGETGILVTGLKGVPYSYAKTGLYLDPSTMLIHEVEKR